MDRRIRYQGAIIRDDHLLLIKHREHTSGRAYWVIPGGGLEEGETEEECVVREMREETNLKVRVERLLLDEQWNDTQVYERGKTYLCRIVSGEAQPGHEPETEASERYGIVEVRWFDLRHPETWDALIYADKFTFPMVQRIQGALGYVVAEGK